MALPLQLTERRDNGWTRVEGFAGDELAGRLKHLIDKQSLREEVDELLATSLFFTEQLARQAGWVCEGLSSGELLAETEHTPERILEWVTAELPEDPDESTFMSVLRRVRQREMLRIVWHDFTFRANLEATLAAVTSLADAAVILAVEQATRQLAPRYGQPIGRDSGEVQELIVIAMGKMGGRELNLSSDIDLIFTYPESGETQGGRNSVSNQEYFIKLGQTVIKLLDAQTVDGFVFRVDMRLRPYGESGVLVCNYDSLELYYQEQGREWERYAMIKARPVTGSAPAREALREMLRPFVYRRYTDFGVIESLRDMKAMIAAETRRLGLENNIKKGSGGIREVEFIAQCMQLIHGGRVVELRSRGLVETLQRLESKAILDTEMVSELIESYRFLRNCEHAIQGMNDAQTQMLPDDDLAKLQLAVIMNFPDWDALSEKLSAVRNVVSNHFVGLIAPAEEEQVTEAGALRYVDLSAEVLETLGYHDAEQSWSAVDDFLRSSRISILQGESRLRLERFLPRLIEAAANTTSPDAAAIRLLPFVNAVSRRSAYLVLLEENPAALAALTSLAGQSPWIAELLAQRPELLDELLDLERLYSAPSRESMQSLVRQQLLRVPEDDLEEQMMVLRRIKDAVVLRVAASELSELLPVMKVSDNLTFLAEVILEQAIHVAKADLVRKHGEPGGDNAGFAVLGYGKLGGIELSYDSDLDIVFIYDGGNGETSGPKVIDNIRFYTRLAQRVVHVLSTKLATGRLYEIDLRLRPHGDSGLVAVSATAFKKYQLESAWVWEHQALVRTRAVAGDRELCDRLETARAEILSVPRDTGELAGEVASMRRRMIETGTKQLSLKNGEFDIKRSPGGIVDIEFVVQYLVLANAHAHPELTQWSDVVRILDSLESAGLVTASCADDLRSAYLKYRSAVHVTGLQRMSAVAKISDFQEELAKVIAVRDSLLPGLEDLRVGENT